MTEQMWWPWFCDVWWEIGVAYTLTHSGDWMLRVLAARMGADSAERQKVDQVLDKIGDFHRQLGDIETEVVHKAVDIAAGGGEVLIIDERLSSISHDDPPITLVLWEELRRRGVAIELPVYSERIHLKSGGVISVSDEKYARRFLLTQTLSEVLRIPLSLP